MTIAKCDICQKEIKEKTLSVSVGFGIYFGSNVLCENCAKPIAKFLIKNKLIKNMPEKARTKKD